MTIHSASAIPVIQTARLTLRAHTVADFDECAAMWADPLVTRHIGGRPSSPEEVWARLLRYAGLWALLGYGYWAVTENETGRYAGDVGLADFRREITPPLAAPEVGWAFVPWSHGRGFATEAVSAALAWSDAHLTEPRTVCLIDPENAASVRVAEKVRFRPSGRALYKERETLVFQRPRG